MANFCPECGARLENGRCPSCGYAEAAQQQNYQQPPQPVQQPIIINNNVTGGYPTVSPKSKWSAFILCLLLGELGIHRFYVGKVGTGILYLLTVGLFGIGWLIDLIMILTGSFKDNAGLLLKE